MFSCSYEIALLGAQPLHKLQFYAGFGSANASPRFHHLRGRLVRMTASGRARRSRWRCVAYFVQPPPLRFSQHSCLLKPPIPSAYSCTRTNTNILKQDLERALQSVFHWFTKLNMRWTTCLAATAIAVVSEASSLRPPVIPLAVRTPYLSTWLGHARDEPWTAWPIFWTGQEV